MKNPNKSSEKGIVRDKSGRYAPGHCGGPGRRPVPVELAYLETTRAACPPEEWRRVVEKALEQAIRGEHRAREWLRRVLLGDRSLISIEPESGSLPDQDLIKEFIEAVREDPVLARILKEANK